MGLLGSAFDLVKMDSYSPAEAKMINLPRRVAEELTLAAVLCPLMVADISTPFNSRVFATDASPFQVLMGMISLCILWGWPLMAAALGLMWGALLRPGEFIAAVRSELLLPKDVGFLRANTEKTLQGGFGRPWDFFDEFCFRENP